MTTQEVAEKVIALVRTGNYAAAHEQFYSPEIVSIEAEGAPAPTVKGLEAIAKKGEEFNPSPTYCIN